MDLFLGIMFHRQFHKLRRSEKVQSGTEVFLGCTRAETLDLYVSYLDDCNELDAYFEGLALKILLGSEK